MAKTSNTQPEAGTLSATAIREQLSRVLANPPFANSVRLAEFLRHVVEEALAGRAAQLKQFSIGLDVFDVIARFLQDLTHQRRGDQLAGPVVQRQLDRIGTFLSQSGAGGHQYRGDHPVPGVLLAG